MFCLPKTAWASDLPRLKLAVKRSGVLTPPTAPPSSGMRDRREAARGLVWWWTVQASSAKSDRSHVVL